MFILTTEFKLLFLSSTNYDDWIEKFGSKVIEPLEEYEIDKSRRGRFFIIFAVSFIKTIN